jgi:hypothetical protein
MSFIKKIVGGLLGGVLGLALTSKKKKKAEVQAPVPTPTRNMAVEQAQKSALLSKRRGVLANLVTGAAGAEAPTGGGSKLGN